MSLSLLSLHVNLSMFSLLSFILLLLSCPLPLLLCAFLNVSLVNFSLYLFYVLSSFSCWLSFFSLPLLVILSLLSIFHCFLSLFLLDYLLLLSFLLFYLHFSSLFLLPSIFSLFFFSCLPVHLFTFPFHARARPMHLPVCLLSACFASYLPLRLC